MNVYTFPRVTRWALLAVMASAVGACGGEGSSDRDPARGVAGGTQTATSGGPIDLRQIGHSLGAEDAPVTVYEFSDFGCPFCAMFARGTYPELHEEFVATGTVRWTYVPIVIGIFPNGAESARAAECAADQDGFWPMHDLLYAKQNEWKASRNPNELYNGYAGELGLDAERFATCYREDGGGSRTAINNRAASELGVRATPSFIINGQLVEGAPPAEQFRQVLNMFADAVE